MTALQVGKPICRSPLPRGVLLIIFAALRRHSLYTCGQRATRPIIVLLSTSAALLGGAAVVQSAPVAFVSTGSLGTPRSNHTATLLPNGKVLVVGGFGDVSGYLVSAELYDPARGTWSTTGSLVTARAGHTATLLPNGKVLVAGGVSVISSLVAGALQDEAGSGSWDATGRVAAAR